jgi:hypothetical protein
MEMVTDLGPSDFSVYGPEDIRNEIIKRYLYNLKGMKMEQFIPLLVGEGKQFKNIDEMLKHTLKLLKSAPDEGRRKALELKPNPKKKK